MSNVHADLDWKPEERSYYEKLVGEQRLALLSSLELESGGVLRSVPIAYKTWGRLNDQGDNVIVLCHALTGSSDAEDWWQPLMGIGKVFDPRRFFIFCANIIGSPYGSASPLTINPDTGIIYGPDFPATTFHDDVKAQKRVLDALGVTKVAAVIGGSMGGMLALEFPLCTSPGYVVGIVPIATSAYHGAWGISWGEAQRQCIYADSGFQNGWYEPLPSGQPRQGLGAARMVAMLTYRSHFSFEAKFNRKPAGERKRVSAPRKEIVQESGLETPPLDDNAYGKNQCCVCKTRQDPSDPDLSSESLMPAKFAAQSYLQYQAEKFVSRFDANCYIHLANKMDSHNVATRERLSETESDADKVPDEHELKHIFRNIPPRALVISVKTDVLFRPEQQRLLAETLPDARLVNLDSMDGHDGFLLEFAALNVLIADHLEREHPGLHEADLGLPEGAIEENTKHDSVFGEAESY